MVIHGVHSIRPILIFKLHIVIITSFERNVKLIRNFISFFLRGCGRNEQNWRYLLVDLNTKFWVQVGDGMKDLFFVDGRNFENIFAGV